MNICTITGRLVADANLREATNNESGEIRKFLAMRVAVNYRHGGKEATSYFDVTRNVGAENFYPYAYKGRMVAVSGPVSFSQSIVQGKLYANLRISANSLEFLDKQDQAKVAARGGKPAATETPETDEEIPLEE